MAAIPVVLVAAQVDGPREQTAVEAGGACTPAGSAVVDLVAVDLAEAAFAANRLSSYE